MKKIKKIVIVGSGTAGWLSAVFMQQRHYEVILIESPDIPTIGVGESTQPLVTNYLNYCQLKQTDWMPPSSSTYKMGVMFEGWTDHKFMIDSESAAFSQMDATTSKTWGIDEIVIANNMSPVEYMNWFPSYRMATNNKSPKFGKERFNYMHGHSFEPPNAVQWDNVFMQNYLRKVCIERGVKLIKDNVVSADLDEKGYVKHLITKDNGNIEGDIFIDCTGFSAILLDKIYDVQWHSIEHMLPNNNAVVVRKKYTNPQQECHPYTNAKAMNAGWRWTIPTYHDISYGYVYSDKYIDKDDAEKELRESINEWDTSALHVPFKAGIRSTIDHKNVIAAGLSAGFVEPLEATSLAFTCTIIGDLNRILFETGDVWEEKWEGFLNKKFNAVFTEIANFIFMHFYASTKNDTEYWRDRHLVEIPENCKNVYNAFKDAPMDPESFQKLMMAKVPLFKFLTPPAPMFSAGHWFQLLYSYGWYQNVNPDISKDAFRYGKYVMDQLSNRIDDVIDFFPNHYDYLTEWYKI